MELTDDDVLEILKLFEQSKFDFLQLEQGDRKITVSKGGFVPASREAHAPLAAAPKPAASSVSASRATASATSAVPPTAPTSAPLKREASVAPEGLIPVTAPMVGKFYLAPSPADPPYVAPGTKVAAGATIGLIEVMKVFTSIKTEVAGVIERILVVDGDFVEFGQPLFLLRPEDASHR